MVHDAAAVGGRQALFLFWWLLFSNWYCRYGIHRLNTSSSGRDSFIELHLLSGCRRTSSTRDAQGVSFQRTSITTMNEKSTLTSKDGDMLTLVRQGPGLRTATPPHFPATTHAININIDVRPRTGKEQDKWGLKCPAGDRHFVNL